MTRREKVEAQRKRQQILDELNAQRLKIERAIVLWVLPLSLLVGAGLAVWVSWR